MSFIKIERPLLERLTLLLGWIYGRGFDEPYTMMRGAYEECDWKDSPGRIFTDVSRNGFGSLKQVTYRELIDQATTTLTCESGGEAHFPKLVATIVEMLQAPYAQNVLAGDTLRKLRKAVLFPDEMAKVSANAQNELKCGGCGKPFQSGEMATFMGDGPVSNFVCSRCSFPTFACCAKPGCEGSGEINHRAISNAISKADCGQHDAKPKAEPIPEEVRRGGIAEQHAGRIIAVDEGNPFQGAHRLGDWAEVGRPDPVPAPENLFRNLRDRNRGIRGAGR